MSRRLLRETANGENRVAIGGNWMQASIADKMIEPVSLNLEGWNGSMTELRKLAKDWYSQNLQGKSFPNDDMGVDVGFGSEGKGTAFHTSGNTRTGWKAEMVKVLPGLVKRAVKIGEASPDERRTNDTRMFHTLVAPLAVNGRIVTAKITLREARNGPDPTHKFYDIAALEIENGPEVPGLKGTRRESPLPAPSEPLSVSVGQLVSAINNDGINSYNMADMKPPRAAWGNFPDVQIHADESAVKQHPDYPAAKSGDAAAASRLVADTISDERVRAIKEMVGDVYPVLVSAHAYEANGVNAIPEALVDALASRLAWKLERNIVQTNVVGHTGANGFARLARQAAFDGDVQPGTQYFLVDDFVGQGGTLANLRGYIESRGGIVLGATSCQGKVEMSGIWAR
ncbi:hypothetical protein AGMMS50225_28430 [Betaproteobacteria bacterium]|nr:hypothetical protein AGMMS50225_28430 [Betaproteobacteria bacterium]